MRIVHTAVALSLLSLSSVCGTALADTDPATIRMWKAKCASCHGDEGDPKGKPQGEKMKVPSFQTAAWQKDFDDAKIEGTIKDGIKREKDGVKQEMKAYVDLKPEQVKALVGYIRTFKK
jgi:mono/diheme cytochrome c family protein